MDLLPDLWLRTLAVAQRNSETISDVVRRALKEYVDTHDPDHELGGYIEDDYE
jgi:hypothetical protein